MRKAATQSAPERAIRAVAAIRLSVRRKVVNTIPLTLSFHYGIVNTNLWWLHATACLDRLRSPDPDASSGGARPAALDRRTRDGSRHIAQSSAEGGAEPGGCRLRQDCKIGRAHV